MRPVPKGEITWGKLECQISDKSIVKCGENTKLMNYGVHLRNVVKANKKHRILEGNYCKCFGIN